MANQLAIVLHASAAETSGGSSTPVDVGALRKCARLRLDVTAVSGTNPELGLTIETGSSSSGPWRSLGGWSVSGVQSQARLFGELDRYVRATWTIGGTDTPSFTFLLAGTAEVLYATPSQVQAISLPAKAMASLDMHLQLEACLSATDEAEGYVASSHVMPLVSWGSDLTKAVARLATLEMLQRRGFQPEGPDAMIVDARDQAMSWLKMVANGRLKPTNLVDSTPTTHEGGSVVVSRPRRGW